MTASLFMIQIVFGIAIRRAEAENMRIKMRIIPYLAPTAPTTPFALTRALFYTCELAGP